jgi:hypothetical protein
MKKLFFGILTTFLFCSIQHLNAQKKEGVDKIKSNYDLQKLSDLRYKYKKSDEDEKQKAYDIADQKGWKKKVVFPDGSIAELQRVTNEGNPIYYTTLNVDASNSTRTNHLNSGGSLGLNLNGNDMTAHVWDAGIARTTHQEYDGPGGSNRYSVGDGSSSLNPHSGHVTGTIMASGVVANAKGMVPESNVIGYNWTSDKSEATSAASNGMLISNHSYGFAPRDPVSGNPLLPNYYFGGYITESRDWDELMFNAPYYLMVVAAGNSGNDDTVNGAPLNGLSGFDKLTGHSTSKNNLVVANAQDANVSSAGDLISAVINSGSSEGPTDDLRIKPDITGNGTSVYSTNVGSDTSYYPDTGTSMASPNIAGSLLLLQEHWYNLNTNYLRSATLKGLAIHTADDLGTAGPDAIYGWGLMNAKRAAEVISSKGSQSKVEELILNSGSSYTFTVDSDGINPLIASISWTDRPGTATTTLNSSNPVLVNDLDIRVSKAATTFYPFRLQSITSTGTGDNIVDPFERINVNDACGTYTITISHKGSLVGGSQNYSLIVTGISNLKITGPDLVCSGSKTYSFSSSNITWSISNSSLASIVPNGNTVDVTKIGNGTVILSATVPSSDCGPAATFSKTITLGKAVSINLLYFENQNRYDANVIIAGSNITATPTYSVLSSSGYSVLLMIPNPDGSYTLRGRGTTNSWVKTVNINVSTSCGTYTKNIVMTPPQTAGGGCDYTLQSTDTNTYALVQIPDCDLYLEANTTKEGSMNLNPVNTSLNTYSIRVYDMNGILVLQTEEQSISLESLKKGFYIIKAIWNGKEMTKKVAKK